MRPVIVHLSNDYPDPLFPDKTRAIRELVEGTAEDFEHIVYSLNRKNGWSGISASPFGKNNVVVTYKALPKGILWGKRLGDVATWIEADLRAKNIIPDLIEAHKFTVEGLIGQQLARVFKKPLICDIQGDTDTNILKKKIGLRSRYQEIAREAKIVFPFAPWALEVFKQTVQLDAAKCILLPVVPGIDTLEPSPFTDRNCLLTVFNTDSWKRKNIVGVMAAMKMLSKKYPDLELDIYGRGKASSIEAMKKEIERSGVAERVHFMGAVENGKLPELMRGYAAFVQPSLRETYGLVYAEALFAGLPILFSKDRGIDGYLLNETIGYACDPHSVSDIAHGIEYLLTRQAKLKVSIALLQENGSLDILRKTRILTNYRRGILRALSA